MSPVLELSLRDLAVDIWPFVEDDRENYVKGKISAREMRQTILTVVKTRHRQFRRREIDLYALCRMWDMQDREIWAIMTVPD